MKTAQIDNLEQMVEHYKCQSEFKQIEINKLKKELEVTRKTMQDEINSNYLFGVEMTIQRNSLFDIVVYDHSDLVHPSKINSEKRLYVSIARENDPGYAKRGF